MTPPPRKNPLHGLTIGLIGLGLMGKPMARNLLSAGATVIVHNRSQAVVDELMSEGMQPALSPAAVADQADTIVLMLSDTPAVTQVVTGERGILSSIRPQTLVIDMGTTDALITRELAALISENDGYYVDAPVSGGTVGAEQGALVIMAGGSARSVLRATPIFEVLGKQTTHVGDVGAGQVAKTANQIIVGLTIGAVSEALALASKAGVDPGRVRTLCRVDLPTLVFWSYTANAWWITPLLRAASVPPSEKIWIKRCLWLVSWGLAYRQRV